MNTKDFLKGYFFAAKTLANSHYANTQEIVYDTDRELVYVNLMTKDEGNLTFAINRGITTIGGLVAYCADNLDESSFDIYIGWVKPAVWTMVTDRISFDDLDDPNEVRINFNQLCEIIDLCGGIDLIETVNETNVAFQRFKAKSAQ